MKKLITVALCAMGVAANAAKLEWKLDPDRPDGRYRSGETVKYTFSGMIDGQPIPEGTTLDCCWSVGAERGEKFQLEMDGVTHVVLGISAMCDFTGDVNTPKRQTAWPFTTHPPHHPESDCSDCVNFAHRLHGKRIAMFIGLTDHLVPSTGPIAFYNALPADNDKSILTESCCGHDGVWAYGRHHDVIREILKETRK